MRHARADTGRRRWRSREDSRALTAMGSVWWRWLRCRDGPEPQERTAGVDAGRRGRLLHAAALPERVPCPRASATGLFSCLWSVHLLRSVDRKTVAAVWAFVRRGCYFFLLVCVRGTAAGGLIWKAGGVLDPKGVGSPLYRKQHTQPFPSVAETTTICRNLKITRNTFLSRWQFSSTTGKTCIVVFKLCSRTLVNKCAPREVRNQSELPIKTKAYSHRL